VVLRIGYFVEISDRASVGSIFSWLQWAGYSHFIEIGIGGERNQAGVLSLPSEPANAATVLCFENPNADRVATEPAAALRRLTLRDVHQRAVVNSFNESKAERAGREPERLYFITGQNSFRN